VAVSWVCNLNPTRLTCRNELDSDGLCFDGAFVPEYVHVAATAIDKSHPCFVDVWLAAGIVPFIIRDNSGRNDD
jgi:hypothetical protein